VPLREYLSISDGKPLDPRAKRVGSWWVLVKREPTSALPERQRKTLRFIAYSLKNAPPEPRENICLCADISSCPVKKRFQGEHSRCPRFAYGVCTEATLAANEGKPLSLETIGILSGMRKQGVERHLAAAQRQLVKLVMLDPELKEYCLHLGLTSS